MKSATVLLALLSGLAIAGPVQRRQDVAEDDIIDAYEAVPDVPAIAAPVGEGTASDTYDQEAAVEDAVISATNATDPDLAKRAGCVVNVNSNYAGTVSPSTDTAFLNDPTIASIANNAVPPPGYFLVDGFKNLKASAKTASYGTFSSSLVDHYDVNKCAEKCTSLDGCQAFNIYFERDNHWKSDLANCPASATDQAILIKCAFYGGPLKPSMATNIGQLSASKFHIVIAGSNAYTTNPQPLPGFDGPFEVGDVAITSPRGTNTYMGVQTFPGTQPFDPAVCAAACVEKTAFNFRHSNGGPYRHCVFFDAYIMYKDGANGQFTCTYYTDAYDSTWATNPGQKRDGFVYTNEHSFTYKLAGQPFAPSKV